MRSPITPSTTPPGHGPEIRALFRRLLTAPEPRQQHLSQAATWELATLELLAPSIDTDRHAALGDDSFADLRYRLILTTRSGGAPCASRDLLAGMLSRRAARSATCDAIDALLLKGWNPCATSRPGAPEERLDPTHLDAETLVELDRPDFVVRAWVRATQVERESGTFRASVPHCHRPSRLPGSLEWKGEVSGKLVWNLPGAARALHEARGGKLLILRDEAGIMGRPFDHLEGFDSGMFSVCPASGELDDGTPCPELDTFEGEGDTEIVRTTLCGPIEAIEIEHPSQREFVDDPVVASARIAELLRPPAWADMLADRG